MKWLGKNVIPLLFGLGWIGLVGLLALNDPGIGHVKHPSQAAVIASERLVQMAQWTISTILALGGALIGLNWYQNERRYAEDKKEIQQSVADSIAEVTKRVSFLEFVSSSQLLFQVYTTVSSKTGEPENSEFVPKCIDVYRSSTFAPEREAVASILKQYAIQASDNDPNHYTRIGVPHLRKFLPELRIQFPVISDEIDQLLEFAERVDKGEQIDRRG